MTQESALAVLKTGASVFLTGEPGSGKTHTVNAYVKYLREHGIEPAITASTGIAATHIGGMTIHSWSGIGILNRLTEYDVDRISTTEYIVKRVGKAKVLIIDEISMLEAETLTSVDKVCRAVKLSDEPFGGIQVVFVGDFFQLPPISKYGQPVSKFAFDSESWKLLNPLVCYLSEQHRQEDGEFLNILSALRRNEINEDHCEVLNTRIQNREHSETKEITKLFSHNEDVDKLNKIELDKVKADEKLFRMTSTGKESLVAALKKGCLSPEDLLLKRGAIVMFTKNSQNGSYVNGTLGRVIGFEATSKFPIVETREGRRLTVEPADWIVEEGGKQLASISQIPLRLAWAMTVHKSQGMSLDAALVDLRSAFVPGQGYVALSRVRTLSGLFLTGYNSKALEVHPYVLEKDIEFKNFSNTLEARFETMAKNDLTKLHNNFLLASGGVINKKEPIPEKKKGTSNAGKKWTTEDDQELEKKFKSGIKIPVLMKHFKRNRGGIIARLEKLGLIEPYRV